jgi:hypothetical protein
MVTGWASDEGLRMLGLITFTPCTRVVSVVSGPIASAVWGAKLMLRPHLAHSSL